MSRRGVGSFISQCVSKTFYPVRNVSLTAFPFQTVRLLLRNMQKSLLALIKNCEYKTQTFKFTTSCCYSKIYQKMILKEKIALYCWFCSRICLVTLFGCFCLAGSCLLVTAACILPHTAVAQLLAIVARLLLVVASVLLHIVA